MTAANPDSDQQLDGAFDAVFDDAIDTSQASVAANAGESVSMGEDQTGGAGVSGEKEWYVAIGDTQVGPVALAEVQNRWDAQQIDEDSLAWKTGMADWQPIADINELAYLVSERPQARVSASSTVATSAAKAEEVATAARGVAPMSLGGAAAAGDDVAWTPTSASALSDLVGEELEARAGDVGATAAPAPAATAGFPSFGGGAAAAMPAFSAPSAASFSVPEPRKEAASGGGGSKVGAILATFVGIAILGGGALFALKEFGIIKPAAPAQPAASAPAVAAAPVAAAPAAPAASAAPAAPATPAASAASAAPATPAPKPKATGGTKPTPVKQAPTPVPERKPDPKPAGTDVPKLEKEHIFAGVKANARTLMPCLKTARGRNEIQPGKVTFKINWVIKPNGSVGSPELVGPPEVMGTSLPNCFASQMQKWKFPSSPTGAPVKGFPFPINIP